MVNYACNSLIVISWRMLFRTPKVTFSHGKGDGMMLHCITQDHSVCVFVQPFMMIYCSSYM